VVQHTHAERGRPVSHGLANAPKANQAQNLHSTTNEHQTIGEGGAGLRHPAPTNTQTFLAGSQPNGRPKFHLPRTEIGGSEQSMYSHLQVASVPARRKPSACVTRRQTHRISVSARSAVALITSGVLVTQIPRYSTTPSHASAQRAQTNMIKPGGSSRSPLCKLRCRCCRFPD
jgi:hypothetical protein